jgi:Ni2+-binding GTPase involved in maturation of urease and hydrogenase
LSPRQTTESKDRQDFAPTALDLYGPRTGDEVPRRNGVCRSDILLLNRKDLAPYVGARREVMDSDLALFDVRVKVPPTVDA